MTTIERTTYGVVYEAPGTNHFEQLMLGKQIVGIGAAIAAADHLEGGGGRTAIWSISKCVGTDGTLIGRIRYTHVCGAPVGS